MQDIPISIVLDGYGQWVRERVESGFEPYLLTFMFNPLPGNQSAKRALMLAEISRTYDKINTRWFHRRPRKLPLDRHPLWIAAPDLPVFKYDKNNYRDAAVNDGLHYHAIALTPQLGMRKPMLFNDFIDSRQKLWTGEDRFLFRIDCRPITYAEKYVTDYVLKAVKNGDMAFDDIQIFPLSESERPKRTKWERLLAKVEGEQNRRTLMPNAHHLSAEARKIIPPHGLK